MSLTATNLILFLHSYVWGAIADSKGRKVVLITSGVLSGLSSGAFGLSTSYPMAIATRFLLGLFNGEFMHSINLLVCVYLYFRYCWHIKSSFVRIIR